MRGVGRIGVLAISAACMFAFASTPAFADQLFTGVAGVALRDTNTVSANQPSAIEFVNDGVSKLEVPGVSTSECTESEFGAFVTENKGVTDPAEDPTLSVPFGVFENCTLLTGGANAPVYVDTGGAIPSSQITAVINDDGTPNANNVVLKGLKLSLYIKEPATTCKFSDSGPAGTITGAWVNGAGPFTEEASTNETAVDFKGQELSGTCNGTAVKAKITAAKFFVETTSDASNFTGNSDTAFFGSGVLNWKVNGKFLKTGEEVKARTTGGPIVFTFASGRVIKCKSSLDKDKQLGGGKDEITAITFENCTKLSPLPQEPATITPINLPWLSRLGRLPNGKIVNTFFPTVTYKIGKTEGTITGELVGEWNNSTAEVIFPETPLEGSTLKTAEGEKVVLSGNDKFELEEAGTLEVGEE